MIPRYRHYWLLPVAFLLALPLMLGLLAPGVAVSNGEARRLAPAPALPDTPTAWLKYPQQVDAYLNDHFGMRRMFIGSYLLISQFMSREGTAKVLTGPNGMLFLRGDDMVPQSAGTILRDGDIAETADFVAALKEALAARGVPLLVALPPNSATIYSEELPPWAANRGRRTEYDVFLDDLAARGVRAVDLRPVLRAAKATGRTYRMLDAHWTARGALAAFNAIVRADSHPDWSLDPGQVLGPPAPESGGDLARMLRFSDDMTEIDQPLTLESGEQAKFSGPPYPTYLATIGTRGPTIMIIGDSFTATLFAPMLLPHAGKVAWTHHEFCRFDWKWIEQFHPDEVWWMPTERHIICKPGPRPSGLAVRSLAGRQ